MTTHRKVVDWHGEDWATQVSVSVFSIIIKASSLLSLWIIIAIMIMMIITQGNFLIDTTLGRDTIFGVFVEDDENHHIKAVTFRDTEG